VFINLADRTRTNLLYVLMPTNSLKNVEGIPPKHVTN
jgi:hypothetical protein